MITIHTQREEGFPAARFRPARLREMLDDFEARIPAGVAHGLPIKFHGEASINGNISLMLVRIAPYHVSPIVPTALPRKNQKLSGFLNSVINCFNAGYKNLSPNLRVFLISTAENRRRSIMGEVVTLARLQEMLKPMPRIVNGNISLAFHADAPVDADEVVKRFPPSDNLRIEIISGIEGQEGSIRDAFKERGYRTLILDAAEMPSPIEKLDDDT